MNARILKKLCAKAEPLLLALYARGGLWPRDGEVFSTGPTTDTCWQNPRMDLKSLERHWTNPRQHSYIVPLPGTRGMGWVSGWESPEWEDRPLWDLLAEYVTDHFTAWTEDGPTPTRRLRNPGAILRAARALTAV